MDLVIIQSKIYEVRGIKVMLDFDLAGLYEVETKILNQSVRRNKDRFPDDFMFRLTKEEWNSLRSQFVTLEKGKGKHPKFFPYVFTEHGVTMLASILRSERAIKMNIAIVRAFVALRQLAIQHKDLSVQLKALRKEMYDRFGEHDTQLKNIYNAIEKMLEKKKVDQQKWTERERIGFKK